MTKPTPQNSTPQATAQNPMFAKFDQALGVQTPTIAGGSAQSRADEIMSLGKNSDTAPKDEPMNWGNVVEGVKKDSLAQASGVIDHLSKAKQFLEQGQNGGSIGSIISGGLGAINEGLSAGGDIIKGAGSMVAEPIKEFIDKATNDKGVQNIASSDLLKPVLDTYNSVSKMGTAQWNKLQTEHPQVAQLLDNILTYGSTLLAGSEAANPISAIKNVGTDTFNAINKVPIVKTAIETATATGEKIASSIDSGVSGAVNKGKEMVSSVKDAISGKVQSVFKGKTPEEILATPEDKLQKLSPNDRKVYFDAQRDSAAQAHTATQEKINTQATQTEANIKAESDKKIAGLQSETQDLINKSDRSSLDEAQSLKPKVIQSMKENSKTYRDLVDKEISQHADTPVKAEELQQFIENRYGDNPIQANAVKERLGLNEPTPKGLKTGEPIIQSEGSTLKDTTIGKIYENTKSLKQDISAGARKGTKTFTADDKLTDDSISVLSDFMKSKGVDLTEANNFWRNYAPLRDKIIKNIQPFTPRGAETGSFETFAKDIQKSVKGVDEGNKDFIAATEKLLNTKIGNPKVREALANLDNNEKAQLAEKIAADNKTAKAKFEKEQALKEAKGSYSDKQKEIADREFEANRKAKTRENIWSALKWTGGIALSLEEFKRLTGI